MPQLSDHEIKFIEEQAKISESGSKSEISWIP